MSSSIHHFKQPILSRRSFLRVGTAGLAGLSLAGALRRGVAAPTSTDNSKSSAKNVIMVFLGGGPATIDMWDMKPDAPEAIRGEFRPSQTSVAGLQICEHMPLLSEKMHLCTLVRSLAHTIAEHTQGTAYLMAGNRPNPSVDYPSLGSLAAHLLPSATGMPPYFAIGGVASAGAGELGTALNPFEISGVGPRRNKEKNQTLLGLPEGFTVEDLSRRQQVLARIDERMRLLEASPLSRELDRFQQQALDILRSDKVNKALNVASEKEAVRDSFGPSTVGQNLLAARRLLEAGTRFITVGFGDWDTHANNFARLRNTLLPELDRGLAALVADLDERGLLSETIVYCTGEFGRTPGVNSSAGRDHWARSMSALLAGGSLRHGFVYGATDETGHEPLADPCSPDDVSATIFDQLGFAPAHQIPTPAGRPVSIFREGRVLRELVAL
jgi:hypothetical protein